MDYDKKPVPKSIAVFGAAGRVGQPLADYVRYAAPDVCLRLITSSAAAVSGLQNGYPAADVVVANYLDPDSLKPALEDMEGIFVVTPSGLDEVRAMQNLIAAVRAAGTVKHIVRVVGYGPESTLDQVPEELAARGGDGSQHYIAKAELARSGLPVTFLNCGATFMDNLLLASGGIRDRDLFIYPPLYVPFVDARDVGEVGARLLLSDDVRHISQFHTMNNGQDQLSSEEIAEMMSDILRRHIAYDGSRETFMKELGPLLDQRAGRAGEAEYRWDYVQFWENTNSVIWSLNNFAERMLGRRPTTLRAWLMEHKGFFGAAPDHG
ncbi:uncharacterized protein YbjT (DUF2867 family) [Sphingobium xenophagum]|uniref:Uncharacterized protein YbjT (DUF2867 family) n=1 Tax=Sphingobium xenophagum TaxID=121428 RepID=A0ABU1X5I2_SPHXE|nr:NmrA family NAD(P)-binding protein [Sphingobium xenophagum]MDR7156823.1 uncharacterized protein YbjT (DUF2867 family) [Sphingobium xenophagum]